MRIDWMQKGITSKTPRRPGGIAGRDIPIAVNNVVSGVARMAGIVDAKLRVIEDVERLGSKFHIETFLEWLEMLV